MIIEFLEKYQQELITERIELKEDIDMLTSKIKENEKFADVLDSTNDSYFDSFTPRKLNVRNNEKVLEIKEDLSYLQIDKSLMDKKMKFLESRIFEIQDLLKEVKQEKTLITEEKSVEDQKESMYIDSETMKKRILDIAGYVLSDPMRAKISLEELLHNI